MRELPAFDDVWFDVDGIGNNLLIECIKDKFRVPHDREKNLGLSCTGRMESNNIYHIPRRVYIIMA